MNTSYDLTRFVTAQQRDYQTALSEIRNGKKASHWMWYIFPQMKGLGRSPTSVYYGIQSLEEAKAFLQDPYLGKNLREITSALLSLQETDPRVIFGRPDDLKCKSCMTLFKYASGNEPIFSAVLENFYHGKEDRRTLKLLGFPFEKTD